MPIYLGEVRPRRQEQDEQQDARRKRDPDATRKAILDAAEDLFVCHGPSATTLSQIAKKAEVTKSLIHHHFGSKEELWRAVRDSFFEEYFKIQKRLITDSASTAELLGESVVAYFRFLQQHPRCVRWWSWANLEDENCATAEEKKLFELGIGKIREAQDAGDIRSDLEPFFIIKAMIALPMAWFQTRAETLSLIDSDVEPEKLDEMYLRDMVKIFLDGVRAPGAAN